MHEGQLGLAALTCSDSSIQEPHQLDHCFIRVESGDIAASRISWYRRWRTRQI
jgi:hypothetical protein